MLPDDLKAAGWVSGPVGWGAALLAGHTTAPWVCAAGFPFATTLITGAALLFTLAGGYLSLRAFAARPSLGDPDPVSHRRSGHFVAAAGVGIALLFAFALVLQAAAGLVFTGCER
jgi:hypothetical protein